MALKQEIEKEIIVAMKAKDATSLRGLRAIKAAILLEETSEAKKGEALTEAEELKLLTRLVKQRRDSIEQYEKAGSPDRALIEAEEIATIERYLPKALSPDEIKAAVQEVIAETGASSAKDFGTVMKAATAKLAGQADGKVVSALVKELLG